MNSPNPDIRRLLIANRGEIARRVIRTCNTLGIETVAVYSDVDAHSPHVREATFSEPIGGTMAYLSVEAIVAAAVRSGADSVHPGYGFLSENPALPDALTKEGILFIGPSAHTIRELGSKTHAKAIAARAQVPIAPTLLLSGDSYALHLNQLLQFTSDVGFPVIIKAAAGGGGRGMRLITRREECEEALASAARESEKAFGSAEIFVEKFVAPARHIEVQIAGDNHGRVVALGTRDCSLQRNNQKIIEEAPALGLKDGVSEEICLAACRLAKEVGYRNLGTVEFLYTDNGLFYFLEVNTRLQVEHPVTELVTGIDLVKLQIDIARGATLQSALGTDSPLIPSGHAVEARLCAEEYTGQFLTMTGIILDMQVPRGPRGSGLIRADMGYEICSEVSHHYDSLLGKIIAYGSTRAEAIQLLQQALRETRITGVGTNRALLLHLLSTHAFCNLQHTVQGTTSLLPAAEQLQEEWITSHAIAAATRLCSVNNEWIRLSPWCDRDKVQTSGLRTPFSTSLHGMTITSESWFEGDGVTVQILHPYPRDMFLQLSHPSELSNAGKEYSVSINRGAPTKEVVVVDGTTIWVHSPTHSCSLRPQYMRKGAHAATSHSDELAVSSPIPGKVITVHVTAGDRVSEGQLLVILDSMKMEHPFRSPRDGTIASVSVTPGMLVHAGAQLLLIS